MIFYRDDWPERTWCIVMAESAAAAATGGLKDSIDRRKINAAHISRIVFISEILYIARIMLYLYTRVLVSVYIYVRVCIIYIYFLQRSFARGIFKQR